MLCFSVDSRDSLENVESKWVGEIAENCAGVKLVLVALKCDLRETGGDTEAGEGEATGRREKSLIDYKQGLEVAKRIQALRYLGMLKLFHYLSGVGRTNAGWKSELTGRRMLRETKPRRQRSVYGSSARCVISQRCRYGRWRQ